ncbi:MAG: hypothetical protein KME23_08480 [Goleter apudmare HA4340-LM2]|jgi:hypothetical protein|nr:hypothetical protein [Goleter apudmare HA4340-LM2]
MAEFSLLGQRLQRRVVDLPGVIDTQNPHGHYGAIQSASDRIIQRLALPETIAARYQVASLQPTAIAQRSNYKRVELRGGESPSLTWRVQRLPASESDTQFINQVKVIASPATTNQVASPLPPVIQRQESQEEVTRFIDKLPTPADSSPDLPSGKFRISRKPSVTTDGFSGVSSSSDSADAASGVSSSSYSSDSTSDSSTSLYTSQPGIATSVTPPFTTAALPLSPSFRLAVSSGVIQAKPASTGYPAAGETAVQRQYQTTDLVMRSPETHSNISAHSQAENTIIKNQVLSKNTETIQHKPTANKATTVVSPPPKLVYKTPLPMVQRQLTPEVAVQNSTGIQVQTKISDGVVSASPTPNISNSLPLVVKPASNGGLIQRGGNEVASEETITPISTSVTPTATIPATESNVNVAELAEQVSRIIMRRMIVERERRGLGR